MNNSLIINNEILPNKVVLTHMSRVSISDPYLRPNICYLEERHSLLLVPRVIVEFSINGTITRDPMFTHFKSLTLIEFSKIGYENEQKLINFWPTGTAFLGSVKIPEDGIVYYNNHEDYINSKIINISDKLIGIAKMHYLEKEKVLNSIYNDFDTTYMLIASKLEGFQSTTWKKYPNGIDYFSSTNLSITASMLNKYAVANLIENSNSIYDYPTGRFLHRLCAFFMGFRLMGFNTYWTNFSIEHATKALNRFKALYELSSNSLNENQKECSAWKIIELYTEVAIFIMSIHIQLFSLGVFNFYYLDKSNFKPDMKYYNEFIKSGEKVGDRYGKESVLESAQAYHFYRDKFTRNGLIDSNNKLIIAFLNYTTTNFNIKVKNQINNIDDLLNVWINIINHKFPDFDSKINHLKNNI